MNRQKIYIACPALFATGGTELLHQLNSKLKKNGYNVYMYYYNGKKGEDPISERFKIYDVDFVETIEDDENNIIIVPEINTNLLKNFKKIKKVIWWMSVDNYFKEKNRKKNKIRNIFGLLDFNYKSKEIIHFSQSKYSTEFLLEQGISSENIYYLSDYLNQTFLQKTQQKSNITKKNRVLYNPKKGYEFTKKIIDKGKDICWVPLENLKPDEMCDLMMKSKVYIDFGNHPGKDRIPREAAISGCCIITGKRGSAKNNEDIPILEEYKFEDLESNIDNILEKIRHIMVEYETKSNDFKDYRNRIMQEESVFENDVKKIFGELII